MAIVLFGGALDMAANILYLLAVRRAPLSIVATLVSLYPASTIILARIVLHERLSIMQQAGVVCRIQLAGDRSSKTTCDCHARRSKIEKATTNNTAPD